MIHWKRHPTKATAHYEEGQLAANVHLNQTTYAAPVTVEVFDRGGKCIDYRGAKDLDDGIGMATAVLAGQSQP